MVREYVAINGTVLRVCKQYCRVIPNFGGGRVGIDITREQAREILVQLRAAQRERKENKMVIVDSLDERLLDCAFCGKKFFDTPESALFGWDDTTPIYACVPCESAQQNAHLTLGESAPSQAVSNAEAVSTSDGVPPSAPAQVA